MNLIKQLKTNHILAISIGIVYLWFGLLKFFPHLSPAEDLAKDTIERITFGFLPSQVSIILLAILEVGIGMLFLLNIYRRETIILASFHMLCTFFPLFLFIDRSFSIAPFIFTLLGQYIVKNLIIVSALVTLWRNDKGVTFSIR